MNKTNRITGVTLLELLVAVAITVIVGGSVIGTLYSGRSAFQSGENIVYRQEHARAAIDFIRRDLADVYIFPWHQGVALPYPTPQPGFYYGSSLPLDCDVELAAFASSLEVSLSDVEPADRILQFTAKRDGELYLIKYWRTNNNWIVRCEYQHRQTAVPPDPHEIGLLIEDVISFDLEFELYGSAPYQSWDFEYDGGGTPEEHQRGRLPQLITLTIGVTDSRASLEETFTDNIFLPLSNKRVNVPSLP